MELEISKNKLTGTFMGMFDIEGKRLNNYFFISLIAKYNINTSTIIIL